MTASPAALRVLVAGEGYSGRRFLRAFGYGRCAELYQVVAVVDHDAGKLAAEAGAPARYSDLELAMRRELPDVVAVCVNEESHFAVLDVVLDSPSLRHVISEKPLTRTMAELRRLAPHRRAATISVNFCERYSAIVDDCGTWLADHEATIVRCEFQWGKYRVRDPRPTMGVLSELTHPLDLARYLLGRPNMPLRTAVASATRSDFSGFADHVLDGVTLLGEIGDTVVTGASSFVWTERHRRIVLFARAASGGRSWQLVLNFDNPAWDDDSLTIRELDPVTGARTEVERIVHRAADIPPDIRHVWKIHRYLVDVAHGVAGGPAHTRYADLQDALWVQGALDDVDRHVRAADRHRYTRLFTEQPALARIGADPT